MNIMLLVDKDKRVTMLVNTFTLSGDSHSGTGTGDFTSAYTPEDRGHGLP